jgi:cell division protein FtsW (lipid II flippase)
LSEWLPIALIISLILFVAGIVVVFLAWKRMREGKTQEPNYYAYFIIGITWVPLGTGMMLFLFATGNSKFFPLSFPLIGMGLVFLVIGLQHRDEWPKKK